MSNANKSKENKYLGKWSTLWC